MELPIDHFRLIGVSPAAEAEAILRNLELRLDRLPDEGFTNETLAKRAELLRLSADLLTDLPRRQEYETALLSGATGLELASSREVAGLVLLWEADAAQEAFFLACKALQPPQAPALGSGREADLTLLAALSCKSAALQEQEQRRYESSAALLQEGIKLLQRMGKLPEQRADLVKELDQLLPYRILDLLSRDLSEQSSRQEGIRLLDNFVIQRGGLEGLGGKQKNGGLDQVDFELFFQQIRKFLTVQEQIDLFTRWQKQGSIDAGFLGVISLVADGYSRRKPERIQTARQNLKSIKSKELDYSPLLGCLDLLLADVELAQKKFLSSPDPELKLWLDNYPAETLAALCDYCCDWLRRDVLPGYRDVDSEVVDLEAWFADRDVQSFVENLDRKGAFGFAKASFSFISSKPSEKNSDNQESLDPQPDKIFASQEQSNESQDTDELEDISQLENKNENEPDIESTKGLFYLWSLIGLSGLIRPFSSIPKRFVFKLIIGITIIFGATYAGIIYNQRSLLSNDEDQAEEIIDDVTSADAETDLKEISEENVNFENNKKLFDLYEIVPLISENPSKDQLNALLEAWLTSKADILAGGTNDILSGLARKPLMELVLKERSKDRSLGESQIIDAKIISIKVASRNSNRIEIKAKLSYRDKRINSFGDILSETSIPTLSVRYILGRDEDAWRLHHYISGS